MKTMFNKRRFLAALSATLLILAALVVGCMNPLDGVSDQKDDDNNSIKAPEGKGLVRIRVTDTDARSILPGSLPAVGSMYYTVFFDGTNDVSIPATPDTAEGYTALLSNPIALDADSYDVTITAWDDDDTTTAEPLAGWTGTVVVQTGKSTLVEANLKGWTEGGTGTFTYSITVPPLPSRLASTWGAITAEPSTYDTAQLEIKDSSNNIYGLGGSHDTPITLTVTTNTHSSYSELASLPAGYYTVKITLRAANCQDRVVTNVMHIYNTMTSNYTYTVPALSQDKFSVSFDLNGKTDTASSVTATQLISNAGTVDDPGDPAAANDDFVGWFDTSAATGGTQWVFGTSGTKVFKDTALYARWSPKSQTTISTAAIAGVTAPVAGVTPVSGITASAQYTGTVTWDNGNPSTFAANTVYTATITLTPESGYTLTGVAANFFTVANATSVTNAADSGVITAVFPATAATITDLTILGVTAPVAGATPVPSITASTQYTGTVTWSPTDSPFKASETYTATITLTPLTGYTAYGVAADSFIVTGATTVSNDANSGVITAVFPATAATINITAIAGVTPPVAGATPVSGITPTAQYTGTVAWSGSPSTFTAGTAYTATIILTPLTGYTLTGVTANYFTVAGATTVSNDANSGVITAVFPVTTSGVTLTITFGVTDGVIGISGSAYVDEDTPVTYNDLAGSKTLIFTLTDSGELTSVTWDLDGTPIGTGNPLTINSSSSAFLGKLTTGNHVINVGYTKDDDPNYSANITFTVNNN